MSSLSPREAAERDQVGRAIGIGLLISIALFHLLDGVSQFHKHPFVFALYVALMAVVAFLDVRRVRVADACGRDSAFGLRPGFGRRAPTVSSARCLAQ